MTIDEIMKRGIVKIRKAKWANPDAHIVLYKDEKGYGPWGVLHDSWGERAFTPEEFAEIRKVLIILDRDTDWEEYNG